MDTGTEEPRPYDKGYPLAWPVHLNPLLVTQQQCISISRDLRIPQDHTLDEYVQNATQYFVSNTAFNFLHGTHNLSQPLKVSGVTNLALMASNGTVNITCPYNSWLSFAEISNLSLEDLTLSMCGTLFISDVLNFSLFRVCVQPSVNLTKIMNATNILGTSMIVGFSVNTVLSVDTLYHGYVTHYIFIRYTDPSNWTFSPLPLRNQLVIKDSIFNYSVSECDIYVACFQSPSALSTYAVHVENLTATQLLSSFVLTVWNPTNVSLVNLHLEAGISDLNIVGSTSIYISNCHLQLSATHVYLATTQIILFKDSVFNQVNGTFQISGVAMISNVTFSDLQLRGASFNRDQSTTNSLVWLYHVDDVSFADCKFFKNKATFGSTWGSVVLLDHSTNVSFTNCEFNGNVGSPIVSLESTFTLSGWNKFSNNRAYQGGALAFYGNSYLTLSNWSDTQFHNNSAVTAGGAIYVDYYAVNSPCFFRLYGEQVHCDTQTPAIISANLSFVNNTAENGGNTVYGASFDTCTLILGNDYCSGWQFIGILFHSNSCSNFSLITSDPLRPCLCESESGSPSCTTVFKNLTHYPGEPFQVSAVVVGDRFGTVYGSVYAQLLPLQSSREVASLGNLERSQRVEHLNCTNLTYTIFSNSSAVTLVLTANSAAIQQYPSDDEINEIKNEITQYLSTREIKPLLRVFPVYINIILLPCPLGFMLSGEPPRCTCDPLLQDNHISCDLTTETVQRSGTVWVNASFHNYSSNGVIVNKYCPNDYCKPKAVNVNLEYPDTQCAFSHSGILCGGCQSGLSLALGSAQCLPCSNYHLALLIPFALAGFALVFFIKLLNLTVVDGTLNGLIFYANVVRANQGAWIPANETNILTVFIAWLNLDLGIKICFFDGLDAYWKTWLQFVFPLYIWAIVVLIIVLSHYLSTAAKIFGSNSVPVLATLFLLSYPKLLRTVISILHTSTLDHPDGTTTVWSYDGNVPYLSPKHVPLFLVALAVILFLWLPYTGILSFTQCLHKMSNYRVARLLIKLKPFLDAYFGPLKDKHQYWVGLLLLVRCALFIVFAVTPTNLSEVDLLATLAVVLSLMMYLAHVGLVYKKYYVSLLENSYLLNLGLLAGSTLYVRLSGGSQSAVAYTSLGIAFTQFVVTVAVHFVVPLKGTWLARKICEKIKLRKPEAVDRSEYEGLASEPVVNRVRSQELAMSYGTGDYREPVLKYLDTET